MEMKIKYKLLFKNGVKEEVVQVATEQEHIKIIEIVQNSFKDDLKAVITFGDGVGIGRYIRVSDLSQMETEILEGDTK